MDIRQALRSFIEDQLHQHGHTDPVGDDDSLILSGLLDSLTVVHIVVFMEENFGLDFSQLYFDQNNFDSIDAMVAFISANQT